MRGAPFSPAASIVKSLPKRRPRARLPVSSTSREIAMIISEAARRWVDEASSLCRPDAVMWCDGSSDEAGRLTKQAVARGEMIPLNPSKLPHCHLHRSAPNDVARTEHLTFICTEAKGDAGPTNNWMDPAEARARLTPLYRDAMKGRTMYVVPFVMGPPGSPFSKVGVEITDSLYVALNMGIMTHMGNVAWEHLGSPSDFIPCLHSLQDLRPERR